MWILVSADHGTKTSLDTKDYYILIALLLFFKF